MMICCGDISQMYEELFRYLDTEKNLSEGIDINVISKYSNVKVWWKTPNGITFRRILGTVVRQYEKDKTLPFDSVNVCITGYNDILTTDTYIKDIWDYNKNNELGLDPSKLKRNSGKKAYFKCLNCGNTTDKKIRIFQICRQKHAFCSRCSRNFHTSIQEQTVYFYVKRICSDAINGYKDIFSNGTYELDVYIPKYNLGIEYDGEAWHENHLKRDNFKYKICKDSNIKLLRISDNENSKSDCDYRVVVKPNLTDDDLKNIMNNLFEITNDINFINQKIDINNDIYDIIRSFRSVIREKSFAFKNTEAVKRWDYELNHGVSPWCVFANTKQKFWFTSKYGPFLKSLNKITTGRACIHPMESKEKMFEKTKKIYYLHDTKSKETIKVDIHYLAEKFPNFKSISITSHGSNNFFISNTKFMVFAEECYSKENVEKYSKIGSNVSVKYTLQEIIDKSKEYDSFKKFREENSAMYYQINKNDWYRYIDLYMNSKSIPSYNRDDVKRFKSGYKIPNTHFTIIRELDNGNGQQKRFLCRCDCGNEYVVKLRYLISVNGKKPTTTMCLQCSIKRKTEKIKKTWVNKRLNGNDNRDSV